VNQIGDLVGLVALAVLVYRETGDPLATSALFIAAQFLPAFAAPALTARIDQAAPRRSLAAIYLCEAALFGCLAVLAEHFDLWMVLLVTFVDGILMLTARGLTRGAVNAVLQPSGLLRQGNGLLNMGFAFASVFGAALGGALVGTLGVTFALAVDALTFVAVALLLGSSRSLPFTSEEREAFFARIRGGLRYARTNSVARTLLAGEASAILLFSLVVPIEIVYAKETLGASDAGFGYLLAAWCVGVVIGSAGYLGLRSQSVVPLILASTGAIGIAYLGMAATTSLAIACLLSVLGGAGNGVQWVSVMTLLQERTPPDLQARVTGLLESVASAATGLGFLVGGIIVAVSSPTTAYAISGGGVLALVALGSAILAPRQRAAPATPEGSSTHEPIAESADDRSRRSADTAAVSSSASRNADPG
jgi:MFS family permease